MAWYELLVKALRRSGYIVRENDYDVALANQYYPVGLVGTPALLSKWSLKNPAILGPSMYDNPKQNPDLMKNKNFKYYILTCKWLKDIFEPYYGDKCIIWSAGIDTEEWIDTKHFMKDIDVLIYDKIRWNRDKTVHAFMTPIVEHIKKKGLSAYVLRYGDITHDEYKSLLRRSKAMVFMCEHETQGIAYHEALASNVPIIAWDYGWWTDPVWPLYLESPARASSVPNFSHECGVRFKMIDGFASAFDRFWSNVNDYSPRRYIENELSFEKTAKLYAKYYFSLTV